MTAESRHHVSIPGTMEGVIAAAGWLHRVAAKERLPDRLAFAMEVCLEELLTNIARHGGGGSVSADAIDRAGPSRTVTARVALQVEDEVAELTIEDDGRLFDVAKAPARPVDRPLGEVTPGGLGMQLIRSFSDDLRYEQTAMGNRTVVKFLLSRAHASSASA